MSSTKNLFHPVPVHAGFEPRSQFAAFPQVSNDRHYQPDSTPPIHDSPVMMPHQHLGHTPRSVSLGSVGLASDAGIHLGVSQGQYDYTAGSILQHSSPGTFQQTTSSQYSGSPYSTPVPAHQALRQMPATWPSMPTLTRTFSDSFIPVQMPSFDTGAQPMPVFAQAHRYLPAYGAHNAYMYQQPEGLPQDADFTHMEPRNPATIKAKKHICVVCDKRFSRPSSLTTHMSVHTGAKPFVCQHQGCGRRFSVGSNLRRHLKTHDDSSSLQSSISSAKSASSAARSLSQTPHYHPYLQPAENSPGHFAEDASDLSFALRGDAAAVTAQPLQLVEQGLEGLVMPQVDGIAQPFVAASFDMQKQGSGDSTDSNAGDERDDGIHYHHQPTTPGTPPHLVLHYDTHDHQHGKQFH